MVLCEDLLVQVRMEAPLFEILNALREDIIPVVGFRCDAPGADAPRAAPAARVDCPAPRAAACRGQLLPAFQVGGVGWLDDPQVIR